MYKLLLSIGTPEILRKYEEYSSWAELGFSQPRVVTSEEMVIDALKRHHADALVLDTTKNDNSGVMARLIKEYPALPVLECDNSAEEISKSLAELRSLLNKLNEDYSNDDYSIAQRMSLFRHEFFRKVLSGSINDPKQLRRYLHLLRSRMDPDAPCVVVEMSHPEIEEFLSSRWHYGTERLEVALRNIFGSELNGMRVLESVTSDGRIYVVYCPMIGESEHMAEVSQTQIVNSHVAECVSHVKEYMDIPLAVKSIRVLPTLEILTENHML